MKTRKEIKFVCLGGGIGTVNLIRGLKEFSKEITVVVSMADDGGSGGRLRRLFSIPPPGDLMNCLSALSEAEPILKKLLTYRFKGNRWGKDNSLEGQKLGNLILVALSNITGSFEKGLEEAERLFLSHGKIIPATGENVSIWAKTTDGQIIKGEQNIDLGKYDGQKTLSEVHLTPSKVTTSDIAVKAINEADILIAGPGDLYTTVLPVLLVPSISRNLIKSKARKLFIVNVANKPFETPNYRLMDYINAIKKHLGSFPFEGIIVNNNFSKKIPNKLKYTYVNNYKVTNGYKVKVFKRNVLDENFPLYHDSNKLAKAIINII